MQIKLCKKSIERLGAPGAQLLDDLREREHAIELKDCLQRCQGCDLGLIIALADGIPLSAMTVEKLLGDVDALASED